MGRPLLAPWPRSQAAIELEASIDPELRRYVAGYPGYADVPREQWRPVRGGAAL